MWGWIFLLIVALLLYLYVPATFVLLFYGNKYMYKFHWLWDILPVLPLIWLIWIPIILSVALVCLILGWIGISLIRTPSLEEIDIEELQREIEEEAKKIEEEETKKESA